MESEAIDSIFHLFKLGKIDLLVATTILENGIDVPNANTIFIERADTYGLADLYQLRGRVGRWNRTAYAYFLIPKNVRLTEIAGRRLEALVASGGYGGGMKIAMRDLELRGAGDILGAQQSGHVSAIGFHLYCKLLKRAIEAMKKKKPISFHETKMEVPFDARLPASYIDAISLRMELYHRFGEMSSLEEAEELLAEMRDRFGPPPPQVLWLYHIARIRIVASSLRIAMLTFTPTHWILEWQEGEKEGAPSAKKRILPLPKQVQTPEALEAHVLAYLQKCKSSS
jgi:transcription-repair coupling factor (superfamily II helicase)